MFSQAKHIGTNECETDISNICKNSSLCDNEADKTTKNEKPATFIDAKALRMMQKMGYKSGTGLGKNKQGITDVVQFAVQLGKRGFGLDLKNLNASQDLWDFSKEDINVKEKVEWLESTHEKLNFCSKLMKNWIKQGPPKKFIDDEDSFCEKDILKDVIHAKNIFDELSLLELNQARAKANPFETIRSVFFMNRAALKMANIDAATDFMFTNADQNEHHIHHKGPFYFADVCAGPGGFSEYILWRKKWLFKGFGLTLKDENDFKLSDSICASPVTFQALYGAHGDGNVCCPENIRDFKERVFLETDGKGVHFMMADGGFSVEGNENIQEVLSKNIYICQCLVALEILRKHGHFVTKLFDIFTPFSVGLIYLIYNCFEKVAIFKPNSSRPANSERYFICSNFKGNPQTESIKCYLWKIVNILWKLRESSDVDILEIVPLEVMKKDEQFFNYICNSNNRLGKRQIIGLQKLAAFCRNPTLVETRQEELRKQCLEYWSIPDAQKIPQPNFTLDELLNTVIDKPELLLVQPREVSKIENLESTVMDLEDWHYCPLYSSKNTNNCNFYAGVGSSKVYRLQRNKWVKIKNLQLVKGTLLYGEFVKEKTIKTKELTTLEEAVTPRFSLHVIDALRLGNRSLADLRFKERLELIEVYCKAVNKESQVNLIRVRPNLIKPLITLKSQPIIKVNKQDRIYFTNLPVLGSKTQTEYFDVNSILLLKTNDNQSFHSTYVLRVQIFINMMENNIEQNALSLQSLLSFVKNKI